ncbi:hypothetical protein V9T40_012221 [Parthenolecanium corni]|uniref:Pre-mRNA-splicing regulator female-lethal(2)D n=1 Tax=Parthenolecanium corni TaxID=536013 RepID=A0AAN9T945_9HEMI
MATVEPAETTNYEKPALENTDTDPKSPKELEKPINENGVKIENVNVDLIKTDDALAEMSREEIIESYKNVVAYLNSLESKLTSCEAEILSMKSSAEYQKHRDPSYREKILLRKLSLKEQEIQEYVTQISELKTSQIPSLTTSKSTLLDPAVNIIVQKLKTELSNTKASLEETQNELNAWKFTPDSNTGKRLMAKCRLLHQENEELGKMISSGRVAKLEGELALQKSFSEEVRKSQCELDELLQDLDEDVEGMQGTIYYLQQELKKSKEKISTLEAKNLELFNILDTSKNVKIEENGDENDRSRDQKPSNFDESSNDSSYLILEVNPEGEEYANMLKNADEESGKATESEDTDYKNKRSHDGSSKIVPPKKQKRTNVSQEITENLDILDYNLSVIKK